MLPPSIFPHLSTIHCRIEEATSTFETAPVGFSQFRIKVDRRFLYPTNESIQIAHRGKILLCYIQIAHRK